MWYKCPRSPNILDKRPRVTHSSAKKTVQHKKEMKENVEILMCFDFSVVGLSVPALVVFSGEGCQILGDARGNGVLPFVSPCSCYEFLSQGGFLAVSTTGVRRDIYPIYPRHVRNHSYLGVLFHIEPAHVCKEKPSSSVVWIGILLRVLVVHAVVARPVVDGALVRHRVDEHHEHADGPMGVVRTVRPQPVNTSGNPETTEDRSSGREGGGRRG